LAAELATAGRPGRYERDEARAFLEWLRDDHFTFLGYREYDVAGAEIRAVPDTGLGILRGTAPTPTKPLDLRRQTMAQSSRPLVLTKANPRATVHRPASLDYVGVKRFAPDGTVVGERRFLGLYTTTAYKTSP